MVGIPDGCAISIMDVLQKLREDNQLDLERKLVAFGSDRPAVMVGRHNGVSALLKQMVPGEIANHCVHTTWH